MVTHCLAGGCYGNDGIPGQSLSEYVTCCWCKKFLLAYKLELLVRDKGMSEVLSIIHGLEV